MPKNVLFSLKNCKNRQTLRALLPDPTSVILHCKFFFCTCPYAQTLLEPTSKRPFIFL